MALLRFHYDVDSSCCFQLSDEEHAHVTMDHGMATRAAKGGKHDSALALTDGRMDGWSHEHLIRNHMQAQVHARLPALMYCIAAPGSLGPPLFTETVQRRATCPRLQNRAYNNRSDIRHL